MGKVETEEYQPQVKTNNYSSSGKSKGELRNTLPLTPEGETEL